MCPSAPWSGLAACAQQLTRTGAQGATPSDSPDVPVCLTSLLEKSQVWMPACLLVTAPTAEVSIQAPNPEPQSSLDQNRTRQALHPNHS